MHFFTAVLRFVTQRLSMWGGTFRDDTIIDWARRELVPDAAVLSCHKTLFPVAWRDKTKVAVMESDWLAMLFKGDMLWMQNISL